ncbi:MAG: hypothetical protein EA407_15010 [Rhodobacteraceae bacterium]|nr:MAG: hypothetical protein EA407_15010 [Paracoccaceae bacterium]
MSIATSSVVPLEQIDEIDAFLARSIIASAPWPEAWIRDLERQHGVIARALYHGIAGLLTSRANALLDWPEPVYRAMHRQALGQAMWEARHLSVLRNLLVQFLANDIHPLLLKGTALAYDIYDYPAQRSRGDTDLLVEKGEMELVHAALKASGFVQDRNSAENTNPFCLEQLWVYTAPDGHSHVLDLHTQVLNTRLATDVFSITEMQSGARELPNLSPHARAPSHVSALLHACIHRAQHFNSPYWVDGQPYKGGNRLIWLMDIHLLASALSTSEWDAFCCRAEQKGLAALCVYGLEAATGRFETVVPDHARQRLMRSDQRSPLHDKYFGGPFKSLWVEISALPTLGERAGLFWRALFPSRRYLREKYPDAAWPTCILYLRRIIMGVFRRLRGR